ncbi:flagellar biosynthetic protein FliO [Mobilitalea sibirica]|uniref:Flagellar biosynthetic protein FliO n=1 Tax=Mobilitalea sibirica TaxID=1462919 RepID=A0A8J7H464_9FIRM|nr:flagellar biosynthetic protein FliO [Mobilitalea sibirica]MBH1942000.1 flagellar biosynthetic protein FliO [Mobilitalea sibirica]
MNFKTIVILQSSTKKDEIVKGLNEEIQEAVPVQYSTVDNILQFVGLVLLLIFILAAAYYTSKFIGKMKLGQLKNSNFQVIDTYRVNQNKMLQIIKVGSKYLLIAIGKDTIQYITELDESEVITHEVNTVERQTFKQVFDKLKNKKE